MMIEIITIIATETNCARRYPLTVSCDDVRQCGYQHRHHHHRRRRRRFRHRQDDKTSRKQYCPPPPSSPRFSLPARRNVFRRRRRRTGSRIRTRITRRRRRRPSQPISCRVLVAVALTSCCHPFLTGTSRPCCRRRPTPVVTATA